MATSRTPPIGIMALFWAILACVFTTVLADDGINTSPEGDVPEWVAVNGMQLSLSTDDGTWSPLQFAVIPLTPSLGLNSSNGQDREIVRINGTIVATDSSNYNNITTSNVAYLSCDESSDDGFIDPDKILNDLMQVKPKAIVLYSTAKNWCSISPTPTGSMYGSILSMADSAEASQALASLTVTSTGAKVRVAIFGNNTNNESTSDKDDGKTSPAVAMSILYSCTGLITLLFAIIIVTGAVRAHRYPERYGPRGARHGLPRQSRAKGLARAVLDTIPIVKFGNQTPPKPDPELELDTTTNDGNDNNQERATSVLSESRRSEVRPATGAVEDGASATRKSQSPDPQTSPDDDNNGADSNLGCSICTEDFTVGEDVRVLPCRHQYHPACIDPWLVNVSGTCPLCRYDLSPGNANNPRGSTSANRDTLPPPLVLEGVENDAAHLEHRNRFSRIFDVNRLRQATVEEQMEALRRMREETNESDRQAPPDGESRGQSARFAAKLKERFRIRTRAQAAEDRDHST
ncbi:hypothetical protein B0T10DRAFT_17699 [Thelonectria olida]|uniref:RING-type E3 ubiquitin transferase n=1 Tax=Thelonectria olida TaxID=1576542 RepID=A0A9P8WLW4_9HYPO|nr:hypothetical protein B0T10DRAFT_17699 [Thelonectria olida]